MREITVYECEFCNKRKYAYKSSAKKHENKCFWNPETRSCMTCKHYMEPDETTIMQVYEEETLCAFANPIKRFNTKCRGWVELSDCDARGDGDE
jgi:hypothetical protein